MSGQVDILCITAHPDDVEISCAGTIARHVALGHTVGFVDLTAGELGTRGTSAIREQEATKAAAVLGASFRYQLGLRDGFFRVDEESQLKVVQSIRRHRPRTIIANAIRDRHPDHGRAATLVTEAVFLSGLRRVETTDDGVDQKPWRPTTVLHVVQDRWMDPDLVVDVTPYWEKKLEALLCFRSQFFDPNSKEPESPISRNDFLPFLEGRCREMGRLIGSTYGEGFTCARPPAVGDITLLA